MMPRPLGSKNRPGSKKPGPKTGSSNKRTPDPDTSIGAITDSTNDSEDVQQLVPAQSMMDVPPDSKRPKIVSDHNGDTIIDGTPLQGAGADGRTYDPDDVDIIGVGAAATTMEDGAIPGNSSGLDNATHVINNNESNTLDSMDVSGLHAMHPVTGSQTSQAGAELAGTLMAPLPPDGSSIAIVEPRRMDTGLEGEGAGAGSEPSVPTGSVLFNAPLDSYIVVAPVGNGVLDGRQAAPSIIGNSNDGRNGADIHNGHENVGLLEVGQPAEVRQPAEVEVKEPVGNVGPNSGIGEIEKVDVSSRPSKGAGEGGGKGDSGQRLSPAMSEYVKSIKLKIDANICHKKGKGMPTQTGSGYPFSGPLIVPGLATMGHGSGPVDVSRFHLKAVFAWIPEYLWPELVDCVPCPNCGSAGKPDGWTPQQPRRAFLEHGIGYIIGFRYKCPACAAHNKRVSKEEKRTTSYHAWDPACLERLPDNVSREFPFVSTRKSAMHLRVLDRLADDLLSGKGFAATASYVYQTYLTTYTDDKGKYLALVEARRHLLISVHQDAGNRDAEAVQGDIGVSDSSVERSQQQQPPPPPPPPPPSPLQPELLPTSPVTPVTPVTPSDVFGSFDDPLKYAGAAPTESYLQHVWRMWFSGLNAHKVASEMWTRADYTRRVLELWNSSPPTPQEVVSPASAPSQPPPPAPSPSQLQVPPMAGQQLLGAILAPLTVRHAGQQTPTTRQEDGSTPPPLPPLPGPQMASLAMPTYRDATAGREHRTPLLPPTPSPAGTANRLCGPDHAGPLQNNGGLQSTSSTLHGAGI